MPVFHGDTVFAESEVGDKRESESRDHVGVVTTELRAFNADGETALSLKRTPMVFTREHARPSAARPTGWQEVVGTRPDRPPRPFRNVEHPRGSLPSCERPARAVRPVVHGLSRSPLPRRVLRYRRSTVQNIDYRSARCADEP